MGNENRKKLTFTQSINLVLEERERHARQLEKDLAALEESFPDIYNDLPAYISADAALAGTRSGIELEERFMKNFAELDDALEKLLERVPLKPIDYGYWLTKSGAGGEFPYMSRICSWNYDRCMRYRQPGYMMTEYSVFLDSGLYFAFPRYSGAVLYMRRAFRGLATNPQLVLEVGLQVVDNYDAYKEPSIDRQEYPTIPYAVFSNETEMRDLARIGMTGGRTAHPFESKLTMLNHGYCQGICKILAKIILNDHPDVFEYQYPKATNEKE